jgi:hypothetical protein
MDRYNRYNNEVESIDSLVFALLQAAVEDMRTVYNFCKGRDDMDERLLEMRFSVHERGQFVGSAVFIQENNDLIDIPRTALRLAGQLLDAERSHGFLDELLAAAVAGMPWELSRHCLCGLRKGTWRQVYVPLKEIRREQAWRYERPENHVPLCYRCAARFGWRVEAVRIQLAKAFWGFRFEAFTRWQSGCLRGTLDPDWDKSLFPLWPSCFGASWGSGSGALNAIEPRMPDATCRGPEHGEIMRYLYPPKTSRRRGSRAVELTTAAASP